MPGFAARSRDGQLDVQVLTVLDRDVGEVGLQERESLPPIHAPQHGTAGEPAPGHDGSLKGIALQGVYSGHIGPPTIAVSMLAGPRPALRTICFGSPNRHP